MTSILFARSLWGMPEVPIYEQCQRIAEAGFSAIEAYIPFGDHEWIAQLAEALEKNKLSLIAQAHSRRASMAGTRGIDDSIDRIQQLTQQVSALSPLLINWHLGSDAENSAWNNQQLLAMLALHEQTGISMVVETHRGRCTWNAPVTALLLKNNPSLRLCADFSHWCCVHESLLEQFSAEVEAAIQRSDLIHARVGFSQGPQVADWQDPLHKADLKAHLSWWDRIVAARREEKRRLIICPEFGPAPYQSLLPHTGQPVTDNWHLNESIMRFLRKRYDVPVDSCSNL